MRRGEVVLVKAVVRVMKEGASMVSHSRWKVRRRNVLRLWRRSVVVARMVTRGELGSMRGWTRRRTVAMRKATKRYAQRRSREFRRSRVLPMTRRMVKTWGKGAAVMRNNTAMWRPRRADMFFMLKRERAGQGGCWAGERGHTHCVNNQ